MLNFCILLYYFTTHFIYPSYHSFFLYALNGALGALCMEETACYSYVPFLTEMKGHQPWGTLLISLAPEFCGG
jgi:hypothetical protein